MEMLTIMIIIFIQNTRSVFHICFGQFPGWSQYSFKHGFQHIVPAPLPGRGFSLAFVVSSVVLNHPPIFPGDMKNCSHVLLVTHDLNTIQKAYYHQPNQASRARLVPIPNATLVPTT